jgi:hypothetical protein
MATEDISPGAKRVEREGDHSAPSSAMMNTLSIPSTSLYTIMVSWLRYVKVVPAINFDLGTRLI